MNFSFVVVIVFFFFFFSAFVASLVVLTLFFFFSSTMVSWRPRSCSFLDAHSPIRLFGLRVHVEMRRSRG